MVSASFVLALPAGLPAREPAPVQSGPQGIPSRTSPVFDGSTLSVDENTHERILFDREIRSIAIGSPELLDVETLTSKELLARGKRPGRTSLLVWFSDGTLRRVDIIVRRDLSILEQALADVHKDIRVSMAPDRDAVVLSGSVPLAAYARRAESVARAYLEARAHTTEFLVGEAAEGVAEEQSASGSRAQRGQRGSVINLIRVAGLPDYVEGTSAEQKILEAIAGVGGERVTVRRVQRGEAASDEADVLVLEGRVKNQVALIRVLSLAYKIYIGAVKGPQQVITDGVAQTTTVYEAQNLEIGEDIKVIGDESGALFGRRTQGSGDSRSLLRGFGSGGIGGGSSRSGVSSSRLENSVDANIARAKALELADGRILSFIEVEDIPQVRVDIRIYEVNRSALLTWDGDLTVIYSDFTQGSLEPAVGATAIQGDDAARVGSRGAGTDVQNVAGFLAGRFTNQIQVSGSNYAIDSLISVLEREGIARGLANTSLAVLSGEVGLFQVGGQIPIDTSFTTSIEGPTGVFNAVQFVDFGVNLAVRPLVGEQDYITIDFVPEISTPDAALTALLVQATNTNPATFAFESRLLKTSARLADGHTLLVGGLNQQNRSDESRYTPWMAKIPLLGLLFQGFRYSDDDLQVVVMVRPTIVRDPLPDAALWLFPRTTELLENALPWKRAEREERERREAEERRRAEAEAAAAAAAATNPEVSR